MACDAAQSPCPIAMTERRRAETGLRGARDVPEMWMPADIIDWRPIVGANSYRWAFAPGSLLYGPRLKRYGQVRAFPGPTSRCIMFAKARKSYGKRRAAA